MSAEKWLHLTKHRLASERSIETADSIIGRISFVPLFLERDTLDKLAELERRAKVMAHVSQSE